MQPQPGLTARAIIERVVDGDTIDLELRLPVRVRLLDCWAPEKATEPGVAAMSQMEKLAPKGASVVVQIPTSQAHNLKDVFTFGRVLGQIWREGDDDTLSDAMVRAGHATKTKE